MNPFRRAQKIMNPTSEKTLVIIDMQSDFVDAKNSVVDRVCQLIRHARCNNWPIVIVEFNACGDTVKPIINGLEGYRQQTTVLKRQSDGRKEIIEYIIDMNWPLNLVVCGAYGNQCVSETVSGLFNNSLLVEIDVVVDAVVVDYKSHESWLCGERKVISTEVTSEETIRA